jgi:Domain of unknown function (DUF4262)
MSGVDSSKVRFATERTRAWKLNGVPKGFEGPVENIEEYGVHCIHVRAEGLQPGWSYTIGAFDTCGAPEIVVIGLKQPTAHYLLNEAVRRMRAGIDLTASKQEELIDQVTCVFRLVDGRWAKQIMGRANWFYGDTVYPVLQCVYPDFEGVLPWEENFDATWRSRQPLIFVGEPETVIEQDFWSSNDPSSSLFSWKFADEPHTRVFASSKVASQSEPVTYVSHDWGEGDWQFHGDSMSEGKEPVLLCLHHIIDRDPTLAELADLPIGWCASRDEEGAPWVREQMEPEEDESEG